MPDDATESVAEHSFFRLQPSINLHATVTTSMFCCLVPTYSEGTKARVGPVQSIEPDRILELGRLKVEGCDLPHDGAIHSQKE